jgi:hypothetical protein
MGIAPVSAAKNRPDAQKKLRERLQARDDNILEIVRKGEKLPFKQ